MERPDIVFTGSLLLLFSRERDIIQDMKKIVKGDERVAVALLICSIFFFSSWVMKAEGDEHIKDVEILESAIDIDHHEFPPVAYLYVTLKNASGRKVSNATFGISYYGEGGYLIKDSVVKNALNAIIPAGETRKYKVRLNGDVVNERNAQYPYARQDEVAGFDVKILNVRSSLR